jgi:hypothetical protein
LSKGSGEIPAFALRPVAGEPAHVARAEDAGEDPEIHRRVEYQYADTAGSPRRALRERKGHCLEGALLAAAALRINGHPPLLMDLEAVRDDDHVVALYRERGLWGGIAKSNYAGLRFRAPIYRTLRELALSYFEHYYNLRGERTLRAYSGPVNLERLDSRHWMTAEEDVWCVPETADRRRDITRSFPTR